VVSEARRTSRYARLLDVDINGLGIVTTNVAHGGVQLCCPQMRFHGFRRAEKDGVTRLKIRLPSPSKWLTFKGKVRYVNPSKNDYLIGFEISDIDDETANEWNTYIDTLADSKPTE
jgi:hypothetical protein